MRPTCAVCGDHDAATTMELDGRVYHVCAAAITPVTSRYTSAGKVPVSRRGLAIDRVAAHVERDGVVTTAQLAEALGLAPWTVQRALLRLIQVGRVRRIVRSDGPAYEVVR